MYACLFRPPQADVACQPSREVESLRSRPSDSEAVPARGGVAPREVKNALVAIAQEFSPRYEAHRDDLVSIDVRGLDRLFLRPSVLTHGAPRSVWETIGHEIRRQAAARAVRVALAATRTVAIVLAHARPGVTVVALGEEAGVLAPLPIGILEKVVEVLQPSREAERLRSRPSNSERVPARGGGAPREVKNAGGCPESAVSVFRTWGVKTLGELAALPSADLAARLGPSALFCQAVARGEDVRPLIPTLPEERFVSSLELEWPIEGPEPLSFVLTRLLEPLSTRLERRDRGVAGLHVELGLATKEIYVRHLQLPLPLRDVRTLRTLALLDLEAHPPAAAIDRVTIVIDPTPSRVLQHTLFTRAHPTPDELSTLLARLDALMGQDRVGRAVTVDSYRPGAFEMMPFSTELREGDGARASASGGGAPREIRNVVSALRRCRQPVPARVVVEHGRPVRVLTDRRGFAGGQVRASAGPWRVSGDWWLPSHALNRDEWDVALNDGAVYRIFCDRETGAWFIDAFVD